MQNKKASIFDTVKRIMSTKDKWEDIPEEEQSVFNNWMCNKVLSQNEDYIELVNLVQQNTWQMPHKYLYNLYKDVIPKGFVYSKYIKSTTKKKYKDEQVKAISEYYKVSSKIAKEYIDDLDEDFIDSITQQLNK